MNVHQKMESVGDKNLRKLKKNFSSREWRLNNLYYIKDPYGKEIVFKMNTAQQKLFDNLHYLNLILKARQMGFSTFILVFALDAAIFNKNFNGGLIADTIDNAEKLLKRVKFAYSKMPKGITDEVTVVSQNLTSIEFSNGSSVEVGLSLRSGTLHLVHVSEYGKVCATSPDKAKEIKSGSLNTLAPKQFAFIESTAEGKTGDFYDKVQTAYALQASGRKHEDMEWKLHFYPWFDDPRYCLDNSDYKWDAETDKYFESLKDEHGTELSDGQKRWYALKYIEQRDDMLKEFPSTVEEAFEGAKMGSYFAKDLRKLRTRGKIGEFPFVSGIPVNTIWDMGVNDATAIWLHQRIAGRDRFVGYIEDDNEGLSYYFNELQKWRDIRNATFATHYGPHDIEQRKQMLQIESIKTSAAKVGFDFYTVDRTISKLNSINNVRQRLPNCEFDEVGCKLGLSRLEGYSREFDARKNVWKSRPRHDENSHGADSFMVFADGYDAPVIVKDTYIERNIV